MSAWIRPENTPFPNVWVRFEGKLHNGVKRKYWIEDLTESNMEDAINCVMGGFLAEETLSNNLNLNEDPESYNELANIYRSYFGQQLSLICFTEEDNKKIFVGFSCNYVTYKDKPLPQCKSNKINEFLNFESMHLPVYKKQFEILNVNEFVAGLGMFVSPDYRGDGIGLELLKARESLSKIVGLKASITLFTSAASQKVALKAGFSDLDTLIDPEVVGYRYMYKLYK